MTTDLEQRLRDELGVLATSTSTAPDAYDRIMARVADPTPGRNEVAPWRARAAVLIVVAAVTAAAVVLIAPSGGDDGTGVVTQPAPEAPVAENGPVVYLLGPEMFETGTLQFNQLVEQRADADPADIAERIMAALRAAATPSDEQLAAGVRAALSLQALPAVTVDGSLAILDWDPDAARRELGIWGTSTGSTGLNPIVGMVFENAPAVQEIEHRLAGSCERFTDNMQGVGCQHDTRSRWEAYKAAS